VVVTVHLVTKQVKTKYFIAVAILRESVYLVSEVISTTCSQDNEAKFK